MDHAARRARLTERLAEIGADAMLVTSLPNVRYLTGFSGSNGQALVGERDAIFLTDGRYDGQSRREVGEMRRSIYTTDLVGAIAAACRDLGARRIAFEATALTYRRHAELAAAGLDLVPTDGEVERLRVAKDAEERSALSTAQAIADRAYASVIGSVRAGVTEREVALALEVAGRQEGADGPSFETIVAFGENAAEPHHRPADRELRKSDVVKVDFGCVVDGYHSDMTRTVAFGGIDGRLREVYEVVHRAHEAGASAVRAGATCGDADRASRQVVNDAGYGEHYRHPLGHGVGLEIHEAPMLRAGSDEPLARGTVVTVEPGVYLDGVGGVRIEDMVEVTEDGARPLPVTTKELVVL